MAKVDITRAELLKSIERQHDEVVAMLKEMNARLERMTAALVEIRKLETWARGPGGNATGAGT